MKKALVYILVSVVSCLTSCTADREIEPTVQVSVMVTMDEPQMRNASKDITRFIVEVYRAGDKEKPLDFKVFNRISDVNLRIPVGEYDFYFWADYGNTNYTITTTLAHIVSVGGIALNGDCFGGILQNKKIESNGIIDAQLTRRVACVNLINSGLAPPTPTNVVIKYKSVPKVYNMFTGTVVETDTDLTFVTTYAMTENTPFARSYTFPRATGIVSMEVTINDKTTIVNNVPVVTNNLVNITGRFTN